MNTDMITAGTLAAKADMVKVPYTLEEVLEWAETCAKRGFYKASFGSVFGPKRELTVEVQVDVERRGFRVKHDDDGSFSISWGK